MRILVMSDSHGNKNAMLTAVERESPDLVLHLGDHDRDCSAIEWKYPEIPVRTVKGNCDRTSAGLDTDEFLLGDKRFFMTHGNLHSVKLGLKSLISYAESRDIDVLLFGHTHRPYNEVANDIAIINPGSIGMGIKTYAVLELRNGVMTCEILKL